MGPYRGNRKLVSVLIPSRGRFAKLKSCVENFVLQLNPEERKLVEIIIKLDSDDVESLSRISELPFSEIEIMIYTSDRFGGYKDVYVFYNQCARLAKGEYLLMWNDDSNFKTANWFEIFLAEIKSNKSAFSYWFAGTPTLIKTEDGGLKQEDWPCVIAHHRLFYEILGFFSHVGGCDSFLYYVLGPMGLLKKIPSIEVSHLAWFQIPEPERDQTARDNSLPGQMLPTDFNIVKECQARIASYAQKR